MPYITQTFDNAYIDLTLVSDVVVSVTYRVPTTYGNNRKRKTITSSSRRKPAIPNMLRTFQEKGN